MVILPNNITRKEKEEARGAIKEALKPTKTPDKAKNILEWTLPELNQYIIAQTKGMSVKDKMKFGKEMLDKIKKEKEKLNV